MSIERFFLKPGERVLRYVSLVGNSDVPYGYTWTTRGIYTLASNNCTNSFIPNSVLKKVFGSLNNIPLSDYLIICSDEKRLPGVRPLHGIETLSERVSDMF